jgi:glycosyltransferase involved in cell wall biosynthesis
MKVLHVETGRQLYGGPQQVLYLLAGLQKRSITTVLVCPHGSAIARAAAEQNITVRTLNYRGEHDLRFLPRLKRIVREEQPDILHCHSRRGADIYTGIIARQLSIPAVISRRVDNPEPRWFAALRYRSYARIIAISEAIKEVLQRAGVAEQRLDVIHDSVAAESFAVAPDCDGFRREFSLDARDVVLGITAQLIERKGHCFLLHALAILMPKYPRLKLLIFGQGPLLQTLTAQVHELGLQESVRFAGFREDLDDYLACIDVLVHPALAEGMGVAVLKAAAAGVPVVAFAAGGVREAVVHEVTGLLVPPADVDALAAAIGRLLDDPNLRRRFGEAGRQRMQAEFSVDAMVSRHCELYRSMIDD